jgi:hypothetical protein
MDKKDFDILKKVEKDLNKILTEEERIIFILSFRYGIIEGFNKAEKIILKNERGIYKNGNRTKQKNRYFQT